MLVHRVLKQQRSQPSSRSTNIFVNRSKIYFQSVLFSVRPSLGKCTCCLFVDGEYTLRWKFLICDWSETNELRFLCSELLL